MKLRFIFPALLLLYLHKLSGQEQGWASTPLHFAQQDSLYSGALNETRKINIYLPERFGQTSAAHTYPVLVLLEDEFFYLVSGVVKHLSSVERMPETIVVSILDMSYMPAVYTNGSTFWPMEQLSDDAPDPFTKHLKEELFPYLESKYRANDFRMIMGLSPTAVYTFHTFVKEPELFDAHIAIAAGDMLGMGYEKGQRFIDLITNEVKNAQHRRRYLYVCSSDADVVGFSPEIGENLVELERLLKPYQSENFRSISKVFPDERHYDVALPALLEALELIFPRKEWAVRYRDIVSKPGNALENIDEYFSALSQKYGFSILPRAERWNSVNRLSWIGPFLIRQGRVTEGIAIMERWAEYCPKSHRALAELAKACEDEGQVEKAIAAIQKAYDLSVELQLPHAGQYLERLKALQEQLRKK